MQYPWNILGLDGPAPETEIRRAYARRLKQLDLKNAPEEFQALVAARSHALLIAGAKSAAQDSDIVETAAIAETRAAATAARADESDWHAVPPEPRQPISPEIESRFTPPVPRVEDGAPAQELASQPVPAEGVLREKLKALAEQGWRREQAEEWRSILRDLTLLPVGRAKRLEPEVLEAIAAIVLPPEIFPPLPWWKRWRRINHFRRENRYTDENYVSTLLGFAALYGWFTSDVALWNHLDEEDAEALLIHLNAAKRARQAAGKDAPLVPGDTSQSLSPRDLAAIFSGTDGVSFSAKDLRIVIERYNTFRETGRWHPAWDWGAFVSAPALAINGAMYIPAAAWWALVWLAYKVLVDVRAINGTITTWLVFGYTASSIVFAGLCIHLWVGAYWYRGYLNRARRLIAQADRERIFHPNLRRTFLSGKMPDQFGRPKPPDPWWYYALLWVGFVVLPILAFVMWIEGGKP